MVGMSCFDMKGTENGGVNVLVRSITKVVDLYLFLT